MIKYGKVLDEYPEFNSKIYSIFIDYFKNPKFQKVKDENIYSIYVNKAYTFLSGECRYVIIFINKDNENINTIKTLDKLTWISIQFRTMENIYDVIQNSYSILPNKELQDLKIEKIKIVEEGSIYNCLNTPLTITLLHNNNKSTYDYRDKGNILSAINNWNTIIVIN